MLAVGAQDPPGLGKWKRSREGTANRPFRGQWISAGSNGNDGQESGSQRIEVIQMPETRDGLSDRGDTSAADEAMVGSGVQARALSAYYWRVR